MIDFDALVLAPAMDVFARSFSVIPKDWSAYPFQGRGVYSETPIDIQVEGEGVLSSKIMTLGVRLSELPAPIVQGDRIDIPAEGSAPALGSFLVDDDDADGQGGTILTLKAIRP